MQQYRIVVLSTSLAALFLTGVSAVHAENTARPGGENTASCEQCHGVRGPLPCRASFPSFAGRMSNISKRRSYSSRTADALIRSCVRRQDCCPRMLLSSLPLTLRTHPVHKNESSKHKKGPGFEPGPFCLVSERARSKTGLTSRVRLDGAPTARTPPHFRGKVWFPPPFSRAIFDTDHYPRAPYLFYKFNKLGHSR